MNVKWSVLILISTILTTVTSKTVTTNSGRITGTSIIFEENTYINKSESIDVYRGVPFAEPPVGELRFKRPVERHPWSPEVWNATYNRDVCEQANPNIVSADTSEDCLYLNIFVPETALPGTAVMVWIYGGAFLVGGGSEPEYDPRALVAVGGVIVVTVNYRLGVYGFLTTGDDEAPGNYGMLDQVLALKWIQNNIAAFNGDPNNITLFGQSAGGASVHLHILSPLSRGLFQRAIMESGTALCAWAVELDQDNAVSTGRRVGNLLNCTQENSAEFITCLQQKSTTAITAVQLQLMLQFVQFRPMVDDYFLPKSPEDLIKNVEYQPTDILIGTNHDEGTAFVLSEYPDYVLRTNPPEMPLEDFQTMLPKYVREYNSAQILDAIEYQYLDWTTADDPTASHLDDFVQMTTDQDFACPAIEVSRAHAQRGDRVFQYEMTHIPSMSVFTINKKRGPKWLGATHCEELQYVFGWNFNPAHDRRYQQTDEEIEMSVQFMRYWTNFAKYGDPNDLSNGKYPEWPLFTIPNLEYKELTTKMENKRALRAESCSFWRNGVTKLNTYVDDLNNLQEDWSENYNIWKEDDFANWKTEFNNHKENNNC
ncbi:cholinesterase-like [Antedon mediterranea]|uniref:cholinesterase-like n=1 Tax=Antedon mediterranea TaxID=105859 RepID=UPI003AF7202C